VAARSRRDLAHALAAIGSPETPVVTVSSIAPPSGIDELVAALDAHRSRIDLAERRLRSRRASALWEFTAEHGERALRALGGRRAAERLLAAQDGGLNVNALVASLEGEA
jgi:LAO/AO transport system kinase